LRDNRIVTRSRLQAAGVAAAFAFVVGLSAPTAGLVDEATTSGSAATDASAAPDADATPGNGVEASVAQAADAFAYAVAPAPAAPTEQELHPIGVTAEQTRFTPNEEQLRNAKAIVDAGKELNLPPRAWTIAVATSLQESNLRNLGHLGQRNDHDSLGLFQQRPSTGWGTPEQVQDPNYSAKAFYRGLVQVPGWDQLPLTVAAQKVQVSAYPNHYAKHEAQAGDIVEALYGAGPYADLAAGVR
jgi:hypothetical protein